MLTSYNNRGYRLNLPLLIYAGVVALSIAQLVEWSNYKDNHANCDNSRVIAPITWLLVSGIVGICSAGLLLLLNLFSFGVGMVTILIRLLIGLWTCAWGIVGGVMLWRDNTGCSPGPLNAILWASMIIDYALFAIYVALGWV